MRACARRAQCLGYSAAPANAVVPRSARTDRAAAAARPSFIARARRSGRTRGRLSARDLAVTDRASKLADCANEAVVG